MGKKSIHMNIIMAEGQNLPDETVARVFNLFTKFLEKLNLKGKKAAGKYDVFMNEKLVANKDGIPHLTFYVKKDGNFLGTMGLGFRKNRGVDRCL